MEFISSAIIIDNSQYAKKIRFTRFEVADKAISLSYCFPIIGSPPAAPPTFLAQLIPFFHYGTV
jgi:hypothetical protein